MEVVFDIESSGILNESTVDYSEYPYKLKDDYKVHCVVAKDINTGDVYRFTPANMHEFLSFFRKCTKVIGHNIIDFDLLVVELYFGLKFDVNPFTIDGKEVEVVDTLVMSKLLNPDRFGGHGLESWGNRLSFYKGDFGKQTDWSQYSDEMLAYCQQDVELNHKVYDHLLKEEWGSWDWSEAFELEQIVRHYVTIQSHFGFNFNKGLAEWCFDDLTKKMQDIQDRIEPLLPKKDMTKTTAKQYTPPKMQVKKDGSLTSHMERFVAKHGLTADRDDYGDWVISGFGKEFTLPMEQKPIVSKEPMKLSDQDAIKQYLMSQGWEPTAWKEKDLTIDTKKQKQPFPKFKAACERYVEQTMGSEYMEPRLRFLKTRPDQFRQRLLMHDTSKPLRVLSTPSLTVGQSKEICPNLVELGSKFDWIGDLVLWLTYRHRINAIKSPKGTGWLNNNRINVDGRISTPADTAGTNTFRYTHKDVCNIPRVTSTYGGYIRGLFGVPEGQYQIGSDAAGLEARVEAHFTQQFEGGEDYAKALVSEKPFDIHTENAKKMGVSRDLAKTLKYACLPTDTTKVLTKNGWSDYSGVSVGDYVLGYDIENDVNKWVEVQDIYEYEDAEVVEKGNSYWSFESTRDHRWFGKIRREGSGGHRFYENLFKTTDEWIPEFSVLNAAEFEGGASDVTPDEAALVGWIVSDGYVKWAEKSNGPSTSHGKKRGVKCRISQSQNKYLQELRNCINAVGVDYHEHVTRKENGNHMTVFTIRPDSFRSFWQKMGFPRENKLSVDYLQWCMSLSREALEAFVYAFWLADGWTGAHNKAISQNKGNGFELILLAVYLAGYNPSVIWRRERRANCDNAKITMARNRYKGGTRMVEKSARKTKVFCFKTSTGAFVARQGDTITITGNCSYGAQSGKIAKTLGVPKREAEKVFNDFWDASMPLKLLKERVVKYWKLRGGGGKFIKGIDGRKLMTRSEHSLLNVLFQSTGAVVMKRQTVLYMDRLKRLGLYSNPFRDDAIKASQMIHYHDECQWQVSPDLIDLWEFDSEEACDEFQIDGKILSNTHERDGKFVRGWSVIGQTFAETMAEAGEYYKFRVPLTADYDIGTSWEECH